MAKKQTQNPAPKKSNPNAMVGKGAYNMLEEVQVKGKATPRASASMPKASVSSAIKTLPKLKAPTPAPAKKLGRLATAASDASSVFRGAANMALGKNQSKTTGGKILERGARLGAAALGVGGTGVGNAIGAYGTKLANATNKATGYVKKGAKAAASGALKTAGTVLGAGAIAAPVVAGQIDYKNRSAESTRRGIMNPGKGNANLGINFDKPFEKAKGRDVPLPDSSSLFNK